jgi:uncharacterized membrane protein YkvA (DUF1232 family)
MNKLKLFKLAGIIGLQAKTSNMSATDSAKAFARMVIDTVAGKYKPRKRNLLIGSAVIAYVLSPIDLIPGFILDDAAIVMFALKYFGREIDNYLEWEKTQKFKTLVTDAEILNER